MLKVISRTKTIKKVLLFVTKLLIVIILPFCREWRQFSWTHHIQRHLDISILSWQLNSWLRVLLIFNFCSILCPSTGNFFGLIFFFSNFSTQTHNTSTKVLFHLCLHWIPCMHWLFFEMYGHTKCKRIKSVLTYSNIPFFLFCFFCVLLLYSQMYRISSVVPTTIMFRFNFVLCKKWK